MNIVGRRAFHKEAPRASRCLRGSATTAKPEREHHHDDQGESVPGDRVLQMFVAQVRLERARARKRPWRLRTFQFDEEGSHVAPALGGCDRSGVAHEPKIALRFVLWREGGAGFRPAHHADQVDSADDLAGRARCRILTSLRHETTIDDDQSAGGKPGRRQIPNSRVRTRRCARPSPWRRLGLPRRAQTRRKFHMTELIVRRIKPRPAGARRQIGRRRGKTLLQGVDQRLPSRPCAGFARCRARQSRRTP